MEKDGIWIKFIYNYGGHNLKLIKLKDKTILAKLFLYVETDSISYRMVSISYVKQSKQMLCSINVLCYWVNPVNTFQKDNMKW